MTRSAHDTMVRRITRAYRQTSAAQRAAGLGWYAEAWRAAQEILPGNPYLAAGVIAALSPRAQWSVNLRWARAIVAAAMAGEDCPAVHTKTMRAQAWAIANGAPALDVLNGPKVRSFYQNITGDVEAVTCDVWATLVACGTKDPKMVTGKRYVQVADAYRRAAQILDVTPREVQAATWVAVRGVKPTDAGFHAASAAAFALAA